MNPWQRRQRLLQRSEDLRCALARQSQVLKAPLAVADRAVFCIQWLYRNPQWPIGALAMFAVLRPQRALRWATRLWWLASLIHRPRNWQADALSGRD